MFDFDTRDKTRSDKHKSKADKEKENSSSEKNLSKDVLTALDILRQENDEFYSNVKATCEQLQEENHKKAQQIEQMQTNISLLIKSLAEQKKINANLIHQLEQCKSVLNITTKTTTTTDCLSGKGARLPKGMGSVYKLSGNRSKPYVVRKTLGLTTDPKTGQAKQIRKVIGYTETLDEGLALLKEYNEQNGFGVEVD